MTILTVGEKQELFMRLLPRLIDYAHAQGYELRGGTLERDPRVASLLAAEGKGIVNSLHTQRLAIDLHLFRQGKYLTRTEDHKVLGEFWESLHPLCAWGGRFNDGNHYSIRHGGRA